MDSGIVLAGRAALVYSHPFGRDAGGGHVHFDSTGAMSQVARMLVAKVSSQRVEVASQWHGQLNELHSPDAIV
jgi:hypothetical protein